MSNQNPPTQPPPEEATSGNNNRTILAVVLGVAILVVVGIIIWILVSDDDDDSSSSEDTTEQTSTENASGATEEQIKAGQTALAAVGCYSGPVDGIYGPATEQAVRDFQAAKGLTVDGVFGPETRSAIEASLAAGETVCTDSGGGGTPTPTATGTATAEPTGTPAPVETVRFTTSDGIDQTLDLGSCESSDGGGLMLTARTETSDLTIDWNGDAGSMVYNSADGNRTGDVTSVSGSGADPTTTFSGDLTSGSGTFEAVAPCS